jgi:hypothetical protein
VDPQVLKRKQAAIHAAIARMSVGRIHPAFWDGIPCPEQYVKAKFKILFVAKEPHVPDDEVDDGPDYFQYARDVWLKTQPESNGRVMDPLKRVAFGILNGYKAASHIPKARENMEVFRASCYTGYINVSKFPAGPRTDPRALWEKLQSKHLKHILLRQIELANPDIIICLGTFSLLRDDLLSTHTRERRSGHVRYYIDNGRLIVAAYHPAQSTISQRQYCDDIIRSARAWANQATRRRPAAGRRLQARQ